MSYYRYFFKCKDCGFMFTTLSQANVTLEGDCPACGSSGFLAGAVWQSIHSEERQKSVAAKRHTCEKPFCEKVAVVCLITSPNDKFTMYSCLEHEKEIEALQRYRKMMNHTRRIYSKVGFAVPNEQEWSD